LFDFYSDTKTKPSKGMLHSILNRNFGDEQKDEDTTTLELCSRVANLLGKEKAVFLPSGTMCNEIAINIHTDPGDEIICESSSHIINFETGGPAAISSVMIHAIRGKNGIFEAEQLSEAIRKPSRYGPISSLVCVEQTSNMAGGTIWELEKLNAVAIEAKKYNLNTHMDGARLLNACIKTGVDAETYSKHFDSVWLDFSKGLGAPVGAVLAGTEEFISKSWRVKQRLGGAMRQSGVLAAMCLYALDNNIARLSTDHKVASFLGSEIEKLETVEQILPVETNIVIFDLSDATISAPNLVQKMDERGFKIGAFGERRIRIVTHLDVDMDAGAKLVEALKIYLK
tara:strand:- start:82 stop:1104 length:1023 start_codon:yes stop_codon:yes gene_type:complete